MVSDKFMVNSDVGRMAAARYATENFAWQMKLEKRDTLRLDLLVEETLGMVKTMLNDFYGQLWFSGEGGTCEIHFEATADMDPQKKHELLSVSRTGRNASARGFMAKIGGLISESLYTYGQQTIQYGIVHVPGVMDPGVDMVPIWTLQAYRNDLAKASDGDAAAQAALDDLEKSIVARLADDIVVGVRGDRVKLVITKRF